MTDDVVAQVRALAVRVLAAAGDGGVLDDQDAPLATAGFDSLKIVELVGEVERHFGFEYPADLLNQATFRSLRTVADSVRASRG